MQDSDGSGLAVYWNRGANLSPPGGSRRPGFDPDHPLHAGLYQNRAISLLNMGNGLVCLNRPNLVATPGNTTIPTQLSTNIGPASGFTGASGGVTIATGFTTTVPTNYAYNYACIAQIASNISFGSIFQVNTAFLQGFEIDSLSPAATVGTITEGTTNMGLVLGRYYFLAGSFAVAGGASGTSPGVNLLSLDLANGKLVTAFTAFSRLTAAPTATWNFGGLGTSTNNGSGFNIHAIMASFTTMQISTADMALLANDPWGYWYPNNFDSLIAYSIRKPASGALPKNQYDWPLPTPRPRPDETHISFYNPTYMATGAKPAGADLTDLPNPWGAASRDPRQPERNWDWPSIATQRMVKPVGFQVWDLSPKQVQPRPDETWTFNYNPTQMATGAKPFLQTDWPVPLGARDPQQPERNWDWPSVATQRMVKPVGVQSWDLSPRHPSPRPDATWTFNYNPTEMNTGAKPAGAQSEDLSPRQVPFLPDATWTWNYNPTQMNTGLMPVGEESLDTSQGWYTRPLFNRSYDQSSANFLTVTVTQNPFFQTDWPLPIVALRLDATWTWNYNPTYMQSGAKPFAQTDWPTPLPAFQFRRNYEWNYNPGQLNTGAEPFSQTDWPLTGRYPRLDATWVQFYNPTQMQTGAVPFNQIDWPPPRGYPRPDATWVWPTPIGYFPVAYPFNQYDWQLPGRNPLFFAFEYVPNMSLGTPGNQPFNQYNWPLPQVPFQFGRSYDYLNLLTVSFAAPYPFNQYDWPLPRGQFRIEQTASQFYNPTQMATGTKPFAQTEWPVPTPYQRGNVTTYTITAPNNPNIYVPTPPTTVKIEWLIRARRRGRR